MKKSSKKSDPKFNEFTLRRNEVTHIRRVVRLAKQTGCCEIRFGTADPEFHPGVSEAQCKRIADDLPGAVYKFTAGVNCAN